MKDIVANCKTKHSGGAKTTEIKGQGYKVFFYLLLEKN